MPKHAGINKMMPKLLELRLMCLILMVVGAMLFMEAICEGNDGTERIVKSYRRRERSDAKKYIYDRLQDKIKDKSWWTATLCLTALQRNFVRSSRCAAGVSTS